jgi:hypothetical protein
MYDYCSSWHRASALSDVDFARSLRSRIKAGAMENGNAPFADFSGMVTQSFEQNRKAMENCLGFFKEITMASPWFASSDLNKKMQNYTQQNTASSERYSAAWARDPAVA